MLILNNPIFLLELKRYGRWRAWLKHIPLFCLVSFLGFFYVTFAQTYIFQFLRLSALQGRYYFVESLMTEAINPWRWISLFIVYYFMRSPYRIQEMEQFWLSRLTPGEILRGKLAASYLIFLILFSITFIFSTLLTTLYQYYWLGGMAFRSRYNNWDWLWYTLILNPSLYAYMLIAPAYASVVLTSVMLFVHDYKKAIIASFFMYFLFLPFVVDKFIDVGMAYFNFLNWSDFFTFVPEDIRPSYLHYLISYFDRALLLFVFTLLFGFYLHANFKQMMNRFFNSKSA